MAVSRIFQLKSYLSYWLDAVDEHSLHSPFFYDFYQEVVKKATKEYKDIEKLRSKLLNDHRTVTYNDIGAVKANRTRKVSEIAETSLSTKKFSSLFNRTIKHYNHQTVIELGTSLGINTLYLASAASKVITFEGSLPIADVAEITFDFAHAKNIEMVKGDIQQTLPALLQRERRIDFAMIDASHTYNATMSYFNLLLSRLHEKSVVVVDDINYSPEMNRAWSQILTHKLVYGSANLYRAGFLFFDPSLNKQHVILQY